MHALCLGMDSRAKGPLASLPIPSLKAGIFCIESGRESGCARFLFGYALGRWILLGAFLGRNPQVSRDRRQSKSSSGLLVAPASLSEV